MLKPKKTNPRWIVQGSINRPAILQGQSQDKPAFNLNSPKNERAFDGEKYEQNNK